MNKRQILPCFSFLSEKQDGGSNNSSQKCDDPLQQNLVSFTSALGIHDKDLSQ